MEAFTIQIAGLTARVHPMFITTKEYCRAYISDAEPDLNIVVSPEDLAYEQEMAEREAVEEGLKIRKFTDPFLERASIQRRFAGQLLHRNTLLLHGSTVAVDGAAYLFTAPCGVGKSTHTRLWREVFGDRAVMVNDDKPFLQIADSGVLAYGSPWCGKHGLHSNICVPLKGICILRRGIDNVIVPLTPQEARDFLCHQTFLPENPAEYEQGIALVDTLMEKVPIWSLTCNKSPEAAQVSFSAMSSDR